MLLTRVARPHDVMIWEGRRREAPLLSGSELGGLPGRGLLASLVLQDPALVIEYFDPEETATQPLALFGCVLHRQGNAESPEPYGEIYVLTAPLFERHWRAVVRTIANVLRALQRLYALARIEILIREADPRAARLARWAGFRDSEVTVETGIVAGTCRRYEWRPNEEGTA